MACINDCVGGRVECWSPGGPCGWLPGPCEFCGTCSECSASATDRGEVMGQSVLQDWVMELPLREQGTLLTVVRGCDLAPKLPFASTERQLVGYARYCFMNPADPREIGIPGAFFQPEPPADDWRASELGHYPQHWYAHLMHAYEVIGYRHPNEMIRFQASKVYWKLARSLHLNVETFDAMETRLSEDRIVTGTVVS